MPELPEVELISRSLNSLVKGRTIVSAKLLRPRLAPDISPVKFSNKLRKAKINFVHRRGKHILFDLSSEKTLIVHLRMSGRFSILPAEREDPKFTHAVFHLEDETRLVFDDQRHFGLMKIVDTNDLHDAKELIKLAPEPFSDDFSIEYLFDRTKNSKRSLKEFLLDQTRVCGLGNIYACEAMFAAGLDPRKPADKLSKQNVIRLHESIRAVLQEAVSHAGSRVVDPENLEGNYFSGSTDAGWFVYDREGELCNACKSPILRLKQGSRSTYFCPKCQKK
ncbi:MAG: bifunctional DNA-formamidopyrimidine glycosylase/DNA-(apurinic or apyrimidinic site) lyase [Chloracidobacterium sp.]|nr:bifunctional DNA-formamidopyrimidine glycosylase/DNA-(apurinic or apyrimidinic site) lyase [Chloracidobacterium sp.]